MYEKSLWEYQRALHEHRDAVMRRVLANDDLMAQVDASLAARERGDRGVPRAASKRATGWSFGE